MLRMSLHKCMTRRLSHASLVNRLSRHSPCMSLRGNIVTVAISCLLLVLVACGDDNSDFATRPSDGSSSSVTPKSSDSETSVSSSSTKSSSSSAKSSSSVTLATPCKTKTEDNCEYGELVDDRDGQAYKTVKIGDQWWMAENLNYAYLQRTSELDSSSFCYNDSVEYCDKYGRLYTWAAAMDSAGTWSTNGKDCGYDVECSPTYPVRGVCPSGWHLPSNDEWNNLFKAVGGSFIAGAKLKSTSGCNDNGDESGNGTDDFGFSALPAGYGNVPGGFTYEGYDANIWGSTENGDFNSYGMHVYCNYDNAGMGFNGRFYVFSVRCLKDDP